MRYHQRSPPDTSMRWRMCDLRRVGQYCCCSSCSWVLLEKPPVVQLLKNFPKFYGTRRFITVFTRSLPLEPHSSNPYHPILSKIHWNSLATYVLIFLVVSFLMAFPPISYTHSSSSPFMLHARSSHPTWLDHSNYSWRRVHVMKLLIMQFSPTSCHLMSLRSKYSPQHPVSTLSPCSSLNVRDQASRPYRTTGRIIVLYILIFYVFRQQTTRRKLLEWMVESITRIQSLNALLRLWFVAVVLKYLKSPDFQRIC
jgi:hypothetical protein